MITNNGDAAPLRVAVELAGKISKLATVTPEAPDPQACNGRLEVPARSAVVVLES